MISRRPFLKKSLLATAGVLAAPWLSRAGSKTNHFVPGEKKSGQPLVISTWKHGLAANAKAIDVIRAGGSALDAVEQGVMVTEADPESRSVGLGGLPDRDGKVTLDACIMDDQGNCGAVCFLEDIVHPVAVARLVMEKTPHVMLAGEGALQFALEQGFNKENLLTEKSRVDWEKWKKKAKYDPEINIENHDTIGMIALDDGGDMAAACTTSGMAYKLHGRVGDSPIIGAGLFVDGDVGAAVATGHGEYVMRTLGSFLIVELMRNGHSPQEACEEAVSRIIKKYGKDKRIQIGYLAVNLSGEFGAYSIRKGFNYALAGKDENVLVDAGWML